MLFREITATYSEDYMKLIHCGKNAELLIDKADGT
jgi:hypothetical protein